jgi:hypothetical protein
MQNPKRKMERDNLKQLSLKERTEHILHKQKLERRLAAAGRMRTEWKEIRRMHVPIWAQNASGSIPPVWYLKFFGQLVENISMPWLFRKMQPGIVQSILRLPFDIIGLLISFVFVKPLTITRNRLYTWGLNTKFVKQNELVTKMVIRKGGKIIHESVWEA